MPTHKVLFVDDDAEDGVFAYPTELRDHGFTVVTVPQAADAAPRLAAHQDVHAIVQNMRMAVPPDVLPRHVEDGLYTGLWCLRTLRDEIERRKLPVIILTSAAHRDVEMRLGLDAALLPRRDRILVYGKLDTPAHFFPRLVERVLTGAA